MDYNSNKSKGYEPLSSGPNMTGYYLGESPNLMGMQTGGSFGKPQPFGKPKTRGAALLARALQKQDDLGLLEDYQRAEAERQKKGGLFGSIASTAGGLLGAAIGGPAGAAIGAGLGKGFGEKLGAGNAEDYDASGTVFSQQSFRDVDEASEEFNEGMLGRSLLSGAVAGATAGLTPGGGIYGQYNPLTSTGQQGIKAGLQGLGVTGYTPTQSLTSFGRAQYEGGTGGLAGTGNLTLLDKARRYLFGGRSLYNLEDGGYIGMQNGGFTAEEVLRRQGLEATPEQLALFESFDPSGVGKASQQLGQGLLGMTAGQGLSSGGGGFGAQQSAIAEAVEGGQKSLEDQIQDEQTAYQSQVLGTAAGIVEGGGEFGKVTTAPSVVTSLPSVNQGAVNYLGQTYVWSEEESQYVSIGNFNLSDIRLKENINLVGLSDSGINIYTFEYKDKRHGGGVYSGVMAQDVPWASFEADNGYLAVDYSKVDVSFEQVV